MKVSDHIYKILSNRIKNYYCFSGGAIMPLIDKFHITNNYNKIRYYIPSSESSAGFCSIGHNKIMNKLDSIVITTSGPGLTNTLTALTDAYCDKIPFFLISGDVATYAKGTRAFQECPSLELTKHITDWNFNLTDSKDVDDIFNYAFYLTSKNSQVHINLPKDILNSDYLFVNKKTYFSFYNKVQSNTCKDNEDIIINNIADIINNSIKPIFFIGKGCIDASDILRKISTCSDIPVTTTLHGLGTLDERCQRVSLKMVGMHGSERANNAIQNSDCIICIGARFDDRTTGNTSLYAPKAKNIIHINNDEKVFNKVIKNTINLKMDSKLFLEKISTKIKIKRNHTWINELKKFRVDFPYKKDKIKQQDILFELNKQLLENDFFENVIFTTGVGNHQMFAAQFLTHCFPNRFITSGSLGVMGSCNSMAIGVKIANYDKTVIAIDGDQSFNMLNDLNMIKNYNIPIKIIIMNDSNQSMVATWEKIFFEGRITATKVENPCYNKLFESYGIKSIEINSSTNNISDPIKEFLNYDNNLPILLNCIVNSDYCLPLSIPGKALDEMITIENITSNINTNICTPN